MQEHSQVVVWVIVGVAFVVSFAVVFGIRVARRRAHERHAQGFQQLAAARGWQFIPEDWSYARRWQGKPFVSDGTSSNIVIGQHRNRPFCAFEYHYVTVSSSGSSSHRHHHYYAVFVVSLPAPVPEFSVGDEGIFGGKIAEAFGFDRVNIPDEEFNDTFKVKSADPGFGAFILQPPLVQLLKATGPWDWRFAGSDMFSYQEGTFAPEQLEQRLDMMCDVIDRIPTGAWQPPQQR